jgi:hypothetical protein
VEHDPFEGFPTLRDDEQADGRSSGGERLLDRAAPGDELLVRVDRDDRVLRRPPGSAGPGTRTVEPTGGAWRALEPTSGPWRALEPTGWTVGPRMIGPRPVERRLGARSIERALWPRTVEWTIRARAIKRPVRPRATEGTLGSRPIRVEVAWPLERRPVTLRPRRAPAALVVIAGRTVRGRTTATAAEAEAAASAWSGRLPCALGPIATTPSGSWAVTARAARSRPAAGSGPATGPAAARPVVRSVVRSVAARRVAGFAAFRAHVINLP